MRAFIIVGYKDKKDDMQMWDSDSKSWGSGKCTGYNRLEVAAQEAQAIINNNRYGMNRIAIMEWDA